MALVQRTLAVGNHRIPALTSAGEGPTQVFLNGFCLPVEHYTRSLLAPLARAHPVLAMSIAGIDIGDPPPRSLDDLARIAHDAIAAYASPDYVLWGHSYGGMIGMRLLDTLPPTTFTVVNIPLPASCSARGLHLRCMGTALGSCIIARNGKDARQKTAAALRNWRDLQRIGNAWPLVQDATRPQYTGSDVPGRIFLSGQDGLFAPTRRTVARLQAAYPHAAVTVLQEHGRFTPYHSWPLTHPAHARRILIENDIADDWRGRPLPDGHEEMIGPWRWHELKLPLYLAVGAAAIAAYAIRARRNNEPVRI